MTVTRKELAALREKASEAQSEPMIAWLRAEVVLIQREQANRAAGLPHNFATTSPGLSTPISI